MKKIYIAPVMELVLMDETTIIASSLDIEISDGGNGVAETKGEGWFLNEIDGEGCDKYFW